MSKVPPPERRGQKDRRRKPTSPISIYSITGKRVAHRRRQDSQGVAYVDAYSVRSFGLILAVLAMCILDGFLTLHIVDRGGREVNPIMRLALGHGPLAFLAVKYLLTGAALVLLLIHKEFYLFGGWLRAKYLFLIFLALYFALVIYELILIFWVMPEAR